MFSLFNLKIPTSIGIIILLLVIGLVGIMIFWQFFQLIKIRYEMIEVEVVGKPLKENLYLLPSNKYL